MAKKKKKKKGAKFAIFIDNYGSYYIIAAEEKATGRQIGCIRLNITSTAVGPGGCALATVKWVGVSPHRRGEGIATRMYEVAAKLAERKGRTLASDSIFLPAGRGFWKKQTALGRAKKIGNRWMLTCPPGTPLRNPQNPNPRCPSCQTELANLPGLHGTNYSCPKCMRWFPADSGWLGHPPKRCRKCRKIVTSYTDAKEPLCYRCEQAMRAESRRREVEREKADRALVRDQERVARAERTAREEAEREKRKLGGQGTLFNPPGAWRVWNVILNKTGIGWGDPTSVTVAVTARDSNDAYRQGAAIAARSGYYLVHVSERQGRNPPPSCHCCGAIGVGMVGRFCRGCHSSGCSTVLESCHPAAVAARATTVGEPVCPCGCNGLVDFHDDRGWGPFNCPVCREDSDRNLGDPCSDCEGDGGRT